MKKTAFTLIELSIVLIIIGLLTGGILKGSSLITSARIVNARSTTSKAIVTKIDGLMGWYENSLKTSFSASEIGDGAQVTKWYDSTPAAVLLQKNTLTKSANTSATYRRSGINNIPSIHFTGSGHFALPNFSAGGTAQLTVFIVFQPLSDLSSPQTLFDSDSAGATNSIGITNNAVNLNAGSSVDTGSANPASLNLGEDYILAVNFDRANSAVYLNDAKNLIGGAVLNPNTNSLTGLTLGSNRSGTNNFVGLISEVIIYSRPLKLQERKDVMSYLSKKYHISVSNI